MSRAFHRGPSRGFVESPGRVRGAMPACPDGVTQVTQFVALAPGASHNYQRSATLPLTKSGSRWRIQISFRVWGAPPSAPLYEALDSPSVEQPRHEDIVIAFMRFDRNHSGLPLEQSTLEPGTDYWRDRQWIDGQWVRPWIPGRSFTQWQAESLLGTNSVNGPWLAYQFGQQFSCPLGSSAGGMFGRFQTNLNGFYIDEATSGSNDTFGWHGCLYYDTVRQPSLSGLPLVDWFFPTSGCTNSATIILPFSSIGAGFELDEDFLAEEVPYCNPAWGVGVRVSNGSYSADPGWEFPAPSPDNPEGYAWKVYFTATRIPKVLALFSVSRVSANQYQFTNLTQFDQPLYDFTFQWAWDFGDGATASVQNPLHTFSGPGDYTVTLTVTNSLGEVVVHSAVVTVPFVARFSFTPLIYPNVEFADESINAATWDWDFGDGSPHSTQQHPTHTFPSGPGTYTVTLTITDLQSNSTSVQHDITLGSALAANFTHQQLIAPPRTVAFTDTSTGDIATWSWNADEILRHGSIIQIIPHQSTDPDPTFSFSLSGTQTVKLTVTDAYGFTAVLIRNISVS